VALVAIKSYPLSLNALLVFDAGTVAFQVAFANIPAAMGSDRGDPARFFPYLAKATFGNNDGYERIKLLRHADEFVSLPEYVDRVNLLHYPGVTSVLTEYRDTGAAAATSGGTFGVTAKRLMLMGM